MNKKNKTREIAIDHHHKYAKKYGENDFDPYFCNYIFYNFIK